MNLAQANARPIWSETGEDRSREEEMQAEGGGVVAPSDLPRNETSAPNAMGEGEGRGSGMNRVVRSSAQILEGPATFVSAQLSELREKSTEAWSSWQEETAHRWGQYALEQLFSRKGRVSRTMSQIPQNMHRVANQTRLVLELIDDFQTGTYRQISWRSVALLSFALLYAVSPADLVPDALPLVGQLDDLSVIALATRATKRDLLAYCRFKGYEEGDYFRVESDA